MSKSRKVEIRFRPGFWEKVSWGLPDSPRRALCSMCHAAISEVPLMCWRDDGAMIQLCDQCTEQWVAAR